MDKGRDYGSTAVALHGVNGSGAALTTIGILLALDWPVSTHAESHCAAPSIVAPAPYQTLAEVRPTIRWSAVPGASQYRVELTSREPEGGTLISLNVLVAGTAFTPPQPLAARTAVVSITVTAVCAHDNAQPPKPGPVHRFYIDARSACKLPAPPTLEITGSVKRLTWRATPYADRFEVFGYASLDGKLLFTFDTRELVVVLPAVADGPTTIAVRPRCGHIVGAPVYLVN